MIGGSQRCGRSRTLGWLAASLILLCGPQARAGVGEGRERPIRTHVSGVPVYSYGDTYILGQPPDLTTGVVLQADNPTTITKIRLKKSWEIQENWIGGSNPHLPRTEMMDRFAAPFLPINLIDGDSETYWTSRGAPVGNMQEEWIRLDLPQEVLVKQIVLQRRTRPHRNSWQIGDPPGVVAAGNGVPRDLKIKLSQDALNWETIAHKQQYEYPDDQKRLVFDLAEPKLAKQVWIVGTDLRMVDCWGYSFSIADVEVNDTAGINQASAIHGTGVTVSSTEAGYDDNREITDDLWATSWDLGLKWVRVAAWTSPLMWSYVEREEKGKYTIDAKSDQAITDLAENGVNVIMGLSFGNYLYDKPRMWAKEQTDILELPDIPKEGEARQAFLNWTRFMVKHFKDRVNYYYIWNEPYAAPPYGWGDPKLFAGFIRDVVQVIREEQPEAKIAWPTALTKGEFLEGVLAEGVAPLFDMVHADMSDPAGIKARWNDAGYKGDRWITYEWSSLATYPTPSKEAPYTAPDAIVSELEKAKRVTRSATTQASQRIIMSICEWFNTYHPIWDVGLFRNTFSADPVSPTQPQPAYYALRNMATLLAETEPEEIALEAAPASANIQSARFRRWGKPFVGLWIGAESKPKYADIKTSTGFVMVIGNEQGGTVGQFEPMACSVKLKGLKATSVMGYDSLNGLQQELKFTNAADGLEISGLLLMDYPMFLEIDEE